RSSSLRGQVHGGRRGVREHYTENAAVQPVPDEGRVVANTDAVRPAERDIRSRHRALPAGRVNVAVAAEPADQVAVRVEDADAKSGCVREKATAVAVHVEARRLAVANVGRPGSAPGDDRAGTGKDPLSAFDLDGRAPGVVAGHSAAVLFHDTARGAELG